MWAILSDVHGNLEALEAVLEDIDRHHVERVFFLGDAVGYGPDPEKCFDLICEECDVILLGNFDQAFLHDPDGFSPPAYDSVIWGRSQFGQSSEPNDVRYSRWRILAALRPSHQEGQVQFVHGSPRNPLNEYVFPEDIFNERKLSRIFALIEQCCYKGHAHVPGVFVEEMPYAFFDPQDIDFVYQLDGRKTLIDVGSVGQPRDGDWRACYVLLDENLVRFRRVEYDVEKTVRKIYAIPELANFLGDRLRDGR